MSQKKVQLKDINTDDNVYPVTIAEFIEGFEERFKDLNKSDEQRLQDLENKEDKDTVYDDTEIRGLVTLLKDAVDGKVNVEVCDSQYDFDQILTKSNNTIYLIKGDQDVWAAKDYVDELFELLVDLRSRVVRLESDTYGISDEEGIEEGPSIE